MLSLTKKTLQNALAFFALVTVWAADANTANTTEPVNRPHSLVVAVGKPAYESSTSTWGGMFGALGAIAEQAARSDENKRDTAVFSIQIASNGNPNFLLADEVVKRLKLCNNTAVRLPDALLKTSGFDDWSKNSRTSVPSFEVTTKATDFIFETGYRSITLSKGNGTAYVNANAVVNVFNANNGERITNFSDYTGLSERVDITSYDGSEGDREKLLLAVKEMSSSLAKNLSKDLCKLELAVRTPPPVLTAAKSSEESSQVGSASSADTKTGIASGVNSGNPAQTPAARNGFNPAPVDEEERARQELAAKERARQEAIQAAERAASRANALARISGIAGNIGGLNTDKQTGNSAKSPDSRETQASTISQSSPLPSVRIDNGTEISAFSAQLPVNASGIDLSSLIKRITDKTPPVRGEFEMVSLYKQRLNSAKDQNYYLLIHDAHTREKQEQVGKLEFDPLSGMFSLGLHFENVMCVESELGVQLSRIGQAKSQASSSKKLDESDQYLGVYFANSGEIAKQLPAINNSLVKNVRLVLAASEAQELRGNIGVGLVIQPSFMADLPDEKLVNYSYLCNVNSSQYLRVSLKSVWIFNKKTGRVLWRKDIALPPVLRTPSSAYGHFVNTAIRPNIYYSGLGDPVAEVQVIASPDGAINTIRLVKSSGIAEWDRAVLQAITKTGRLPKDQDGVIPEAVTSPPGLVIRFTR